MSVFDENGRLMHSFQEFTSRHCYTCKYYGSIMRLLDVSWPQMIVLTNVLICDHGFPTEFTLWCRNIRNTKLDGSTLLWSMEVLYAEDSVVEREFN